MTEKQYNKLAKKMEKLCKGLHDLMENYRPEELCEILMTSAPPEDVEVVGLFTINMQAAFTKRICDMVYAADEQCESDASICATCDSKETCPDRKDNVWIQ